MHKPKVLDALIVLVLFVVVVFYLVVAISTNDPVWMLPYFAGEPSRIVLYDKGKTVEITPGSADYEPLNRALNRALSKVVGYHDSLGLSEDTLAAYRTEDVALEVFYPQPVVIHSRFHFGRPNTLLIPLSGRHSQYNVVFGGHDGNYWPGAPSLKDLSALKETLAERGYWQGDN